MATIISVQKRDGSRAEHALEVIKNNADIRHGDVLRAYYLKRGRKAHVLHFLFNDTKKIGKAIVRSGDFSQYEVLEVVGITQH